MPWEQSTDCLALDHSVEALDAYQYQFESPRIRIRPDFAAYALESFTPQRPMREALLDLTTRIYKDFPLRLQGNHGPHAQPKRSSRSVAASARTSPTSRSPAFVRSKIAARYVSGYLRTYPPPGKPRLIGADALPRLGLRLLSRRRLARHGPHQ